MLNIISRSKNIKTYGSSMLPILHSGDVIQTTKTTLQKVKVNEILFVKKRGRYFTHRVIYKSDNFLITKGDNNLKSDGKIYSKNIIGIVKKIKRDKQILDVNYLYLVQSSIYFQEIKKVKRLFYKSKIDPVFLKGLPLYLYLDGQHPKRYYSDCDILIEHKDFDKISKAFVQLGYKKLNTSFSKTQNKLKRRASEVSYRKYVNGLPIVFDVHFEIVFMMTQLGDLDALYPRKLLNNLTHNFFSTSRVIKLQDNSFRILSSENLFVYLLLHLYHHNFKGAYRYEFIKNLLKKEKIDFSKVAYLIKAYKLQNFVYPVILLLNKYYFLNIKISFLSEIKPINISENFVKKLISRVNIFDDEEKIDSGVKRFSYLFNLSPNRMLRKWSILYDPQVIYSIFWVFIKRISRFS